MLLLADKSYFERHYPPFSPFFCELYARAVTTIEADEAVASSDFLKKRKIPEFG